MKHIVAECRREANLKRSAVLKRNQYLKLVLLLFLIVLPLSCSLSCGGETAANTTLSFVQGEVQVMKAGSSEWVPAEVDMELETNDTIKVGPTAEARITFFDGSIIELSAGTQIQILELLQGEITSIRLKQEIGETLSIIEQLVDPAARYEIETPVAVAAVRGSSMIVIVAPDGTTTVQNLEGQISVIAQGVEVAIPVGSMSTVQPGEAPSEPTPVESFTGNPSGEGNGTVAAPTSDNGNDGTTITTSPSETPSEPSETPSEPSETPSEPTPTSSFPGSLLGWWKFDEGSGTVAADASGNGNDGTIFGATWISSPDGSALSFNGAGQYVDCGYSEALRPINNLTIEMWIKPGDSQTQWTNILGCHQNWQGYVVEQDSNNLNSYYFAYNGDGTESHWQGIDITTQLQAGVWQHFVVQKEGNIIRHYLDGVLTAEGTVDPSYETIYYKPNEPFYIGIGWRLDSNRYFNGEIDEVRIWGN